MEQWRKVPGYENYEISIDTKEGKCRSLKTGKVLSNKPNKSKRIVWCLNGKYRQAARWIATTFPELVENEYFEGAEIDHKDADRLNNRPSNLKWVTRKGNMLNPITRKNCSESQNKKSPTQYKMDGTYVATYKSVREAQKITGVDKGHISACCLGKQKSAGKIGEEKFIWRYE